MIKQNNRKREIIHSFKAESESKLIDLMTRMMPNHSRTTIKQLLSKRCITVNETPTSQFDDIVKRGATVKIYNIGFPEKLNHPQVRTVYIDDHLIVIEKEAGIPTIAVGGSEGPTVFRVVAKHLKESNPNEKVFLLNRLDRDTSGLIVVARNRDLQQSILENWRNFIVNNKFCAIAGRAMNSETGTLESQPEKDKKGNIIKKMSPSQHRGKRFKASYQVMNKTSHLTMLDITLNTRHNSIRSELNRIGHAVLGDQRGDRKQIAFRKGEIALHAYKLAFKHPVTGKNLSFTFPTPSYYERFMRSHLPQSAKSYLKESATLMVEKREKRKSINKRKKY